MALKELFTFHFSFVGFLLAVIIGALLFFALKAFKSLLAQEKISFPGKPFFARYIYLFQAFAGFVYLIWAYQAIFQATLISEFLIILTVAFILYWISTFYLKDFLAGLYIKALTNPFASTIQLEDGRLGNLEALGLLRARIRTEEQTILLIPYHKLINQTITLYQPDEKTHVAEMQFLTEADNVDEELLNRIRQFLLSSPYLLPGSLPDIRLAEQENAKVILKVRCRLLSQEFKQRLQEEIRKLFIKKQSA